MEQEHQQEHDSFTFRPMKLVDIPSIMIIEREAFTLPWTEDAFRNELTNNLFAKYVVLENNGNPIGYAGMWTIVDEAHVTNIALLEAYRGRKLGGLLLEELMNTASQIGMLRITLEVRVSNMIAQKLYERKGFTSVGIRKGYYSDNHEDAVIMWADLAPYREHASQEGSA
ncbi:ribosomal protein S18-alanine N-acetyltransferase [Paenibacillus sp. IHBB 10380]|uniref:ribosomal protein S18-alanine N-acetyltransferase n=1 Tax=Paenibacillus sp. IHBB 10380 TaxID=1566358 RepID=UPI0005CFC72B|nr:ribosomal protein S18-alanine N-acetyltransferase [Paenibacillus sp. IHBB 10380]AJS61612.1 alanine acetyltransferase [Paenibacillus sp. IHBB 10380]